MICRRIAGVSALCNMGQKYDQWYDGEWDIVRMWGFKLMCCDCSLVHEMNFRKTPGGLMIQVFRDERATAAARRKTNKKGKKRMACKKRKKKKKTYSY
jgi:hypothetical protein